MLDCLKAPAVSVIDLTVAIWGAILILVVMVQTLRAHLDASRKN